MVLKTVAVTAIHHQSLPHTCLLQLLLCLGDALRIIVGALLTASQNDEAVVVADSAYNGDVAGFGDGEEVMRVPDSSNGVDCDLQAAICAVLEAYWERQTRCQLAVQLALCCTGADRTDGQQIGQELRRDGIQHFASQWHALVRKVDEQLPGHLEALVDVESVVNIRVVDQALPSHRCPRLLQVASHDDEQVIFVLLFQFQQSVAVLQCSLGSVYRARSNDDKQAVLRVLASYDRGRLIPTLDDRFV